MKVTRLVILISIVFYALVSKGQESEKTFFKSKEYNNSFYQYLTKDLKYYTDSCLNKEVSVYITMKSNKVDSVIVYGELPQPLGEKLVKRIKSTDGLWDLDEDYTIILEVFFRFFNHCNQDHIELNFALHSLMMNKYFAIERYDSFLRADNYLFAIPLSFDNDIKK
ncbi:hypothetical protein GVN16_19230 [Emticicia sp. CRIBPO]|uniref:hypothetical protein n=1 Tax=Emticicia sp. CRIBPO TaxID=2683258 RepID=UPI001411CDF6|nr:hypothetical protein [Emticicia sp. CRIBPO]NBA87911.1 hypothetical protein [Emticicia sp. CRIBPO]